jgi:hypothetical protein
MPSRRVIPKKCGYSFIWNLPASCNPSQRHIMCDFGTWSIQATEPANLITRLGLIIKKQPEKQLSADEKNAINDEMDGWEREWRAQND